MARNKALIDRRGLDRNFLRRAFLKMLPFNDHEAFSNWDNLIVGCCQLAAAIHLWLLPMWLFARRWGGSRLAFHWIGGLALVCGFVGFNLAVGWAALDGVMEYGTALSLDFLVRQTVHRWELILLTSLLGGAAGFWYLLIRDENGRIHRRKARRARALAGRDCLAR